jgi:hypothetical protein
MACNYPTIYIPLGSTHVVSFDMTPRLYDGELLTGTPAVADEGSTGELTISNKQVNSVAYDDDGETVAVGKAVQFTLTTSATSSTTYTLTILTSTDGTPTQTLADKLVVVFE